MQAVEDGSLRKENVGQGISDFLDEPGGWNVHQLQKHFWEVYVPQILKIPMSPRNREDFLAWFSERHGKFFF